MTKRKALVMMLKIVDECSSHEADMGSCNECLFGNGGRCMVSGGKDIPTEWLVNEKVRDWMNGDDV